MHRRCDRNLQTHVPQIASYTLQLIKLTKILFIAQFMSQLYVYIQIRPLQQIRDVSKHIYTINYSNTTSPQQLLALYRKVCVYILKLEVKGLTNT